MTDTDWANLISWLGRGNMVLVIPRKGVPALYRVQKQEPDKATTHARWLKAKEILHGKSLQE